MKIDLAFERDPPVSGCYTHLSVRVQVGAIMICNHLMEAGRASRLGFEVDETILHEVKIFVEPVT